MSLPDPALPLGRLLFDLRSQPEGLSDREAARRLVVFGSNELSRRGKRLVAGAAASVLLVTKLDFSVRQ
ncbi:hypothetical protein LFT44_09150 [Arthrobacter sp. FW306-05-C]|uniref:cation-transporting P-type ATPase n=1 Tax=Arthrobacter sp. FW306-05-C TaxID=2879620 RepID=UPI001F2D7246|nr:cation-transporting P-type ATPase [Arthrobacter sp. FW306-05-C]UKA68530.1 hypothetical protein LFT44_09150 [Arthrobacter sp. FW306-05-C]